MAVLLAALLAEQPAAACCDDVLSCAGAVASGGLTCAIEVALDGLKALLDRATRERDDTSKAFEDGVQASIQETKSALDAWKKVAADAAADAAASARKAADLVNEDQARLKRLVGLSPAAVPAPAAPAAGSKLGTSATAKAYATPTPTPKTAVRAGAAALPANQAMLTDLITPQEAAKIVHDDSPEQLRREIEREKAKAQGLEMSSAQAAEKAKQAADMSALASRASFAAGFVAGMAGLIVAIQKGISNPLGAIGALAAAVEAIGLVEKALTELQPLLDQEAQKRADLADAPRPDADAARAAAQKARDLLAKLEKIVRLRTLLERQTEFRAALVTTTPGPSLRARLATSARLADFTRPVKLRLGTLKADTRKLALVRPPDVTPFRTKLAAGLDAQFKGKSPAAAAATRDALLADARRRYASDPKTLAGVEKIVIDAAARR